MLTAKDINKTDQKRPGALRDARIQAGFLFKEAHARRRLFSGIAVEEDYEIFPSKKKLEWFEEVGVTKKDEELAKKFFSRIRYFGIVRAYLSTWKTKKHRRRRR